MLQALLSFIGDLPQGGRAHTRVLLPPPFRPEQDAPERASDPAKRVMVEKKLSAPENQVEYVATIDTALFNVVWRQIMISGDLTLSPKFLAGLKPGLLGHPADELDLEDQCGVRRDRGRGAGLSWRRGEAGGQNNTSP